LGQGKRYDKTLYIASKEQTKRWIDTNLRLLTVAEKPVKRAFLMPVKTISYVELAYIFKLFMKK